MCWLHYPRVLNGPVKVECQLIILNLLGIHIELCLVKEVRVNACKHSLKEWILA